MNEFLEDVVSGCIEDASIAELESLGKAYRVEWNDHEGNQRERFFARPEDAFAEAMELRKKSDYVEVYGPDGQPVEI